MKKFLEKIEDDAKTKSPVVLAFGRMNPPTIGHEKLVERVREIAHDHKAPHHIVISHSTDAKKNPLLVKDKLKHARRFFPGANIESSSKELPTFLHHAAKLNAAGHDHLIMVAGSDRIPEYEQKLQQYNGTHKGALYNFKKIEVKSAGHRDPDAEGAEGMSASKMREHAKNNDYGSFRQGIPTHVAEKHARELFKDVRQGMGIHESSEHGMFKAIFVSGGPGSGKDIIIREAIAHSNCVELNSTIAINILNDKHKLHEASRDLRREAVRNRLPLVITGTTNEKHNLLVVREELEELGYETMMIFVNTTNEASKKRNEGHERMLEESLRFDRWKSTQETSNLFQKNFTKYLEFDNSLDLNEATEFQKSEKDEDISIIYEMTNWFFSMEVSNDIAESWMNKNRKPNINKLFENFIDRRQYVSKFKTNRQTIFAEAADCGCSSGTKGKYKRLADNNCPACQIGAKLGKPDDVRDGDIAPNTKYTFRTYHEGSEPTIQVRPEPKETRFQQDADKIKAKKQKTSPTEAGKVIKAAGVSPEYDTRGQGTVYPMSGLGQVTYREQTENKYGNTAEVKRKSFTRFREAIDSPNVEMGVTGGYHGPSNKEPMETQADRVLNQTSNIKKKKK